MAIYKQVAEQNAVIHTPTGRVIYLDQPQTIHTEAYLAWVAEENAADPADPPILIPAPPFDQVRDECLASVRAAREVVLNRLAGIALFDPSKQEACASARAALLNITTDPAVVMASDEAALKLALVAAYRAIVLAAGPGIANAFAEFNL